MNSASKKNGKYRFNIIDVLLLLIIILSVCAIAFLVLYDGKKDSGESGENKIDITYSVKQSEVAGMLRGKIDIGQPVYDSVTMECIGQVTKVGFENSRYSVYDPESKLWVEESYPDKIDIEIEISVEAVVESDGRYSINGYILNVGEEMDLRFPYYTGKAVCISVNGGGEQ